jgi:hypothetical protein
MSEKPIMWSDAQNTTYQFKVMAFNGLPAFLPYHHHHHLPPWIR